MTETITQLLQKRKQERSVLQVRGLHKKYNEGRANEVYVLKGMDFDIPAGQMVAIMGPSGCGKTTLLNLIGGLDGFSEGTIRISETDLDSMNDAKLTEFRMNNIGFIFQLFNLFDAQTALENVKLPLLLQRINPRLAEDRARMILQEVGLGNRFDDTPARLSGGEQQKVAISRALVTEPTLILADEPTGDLDTASSDDIMALFRRMQAENPGMSIVIVTHSQRIADQCDRIIRIEEGIIAADQLTDLGEEAELLNSQEDA
jgi:ABC-type lipoprotein export system ATPase subunit